jgi:hypothetical protein
MSAMIAVIVVPSEPHVLGAGREFISEGKAVFFDISASLLA